MVNSKLPMSRRLHLAVIIPISQTLLIALTISWLVNATFIAVNELAYFVGDNYFILFPGIRAYILIALPQKPA